MNRSYSWFCTSVQVCVLVLVGCLSSAPAAPTDEAPADKWPMFRGCLAGTGRSASMLHLPLVENWHRTFPKTAFESTPVIADDTIYIGDLDGIFYALAIASGETKWTFKAQAGFRSAAAISTDAAEPLVVVGDSSGLVRAFDQRSGAVQWEYETEGEISGGPSIVPLGKDSRVLVGSQDASLSCLLLNNGKLLWKHTIADQIRCSPTVAGGRVFLAGCDGKLHVIDTLTGKSVGDVSIDGPTGTTPAALNDRVYFGSEGGVFWAIDFQARSVAWKVATAANSQAYRSSAAIVEDLAIVGSRGKAIEAFAIADGERKWRSSTRGRVDASPVVVRGTINGIDSPPVSLVIIGDSAGTLSALRSSDGTRVWTFDAGNGFSASPAVAKGRVVMASDDGTVWCFGSQ